jgi:uncharacterized protein (DUF2267 family)
MGFHRSVFDAIAGFDEAFNSGSTEVDFCLRAQYEVAPSASSLTAVVHDRLRDKLRPYTRQYYSHALENALLYAKHHALGKLPEQSRKSERRALLLLRVKRHTHLQRLVKPEHRWLTYAVPPGSRSRCAGS